MNIRNLASTAAVAATLSLGLGIEGRAHEPEGTFTDVKPLGPEVNSPFHDDLGVGSGDGLTLAFSSDRPGGSGDYDMYLADREGGSASFTEVRNIQELNTGAFDIANFLSEDGLTLYFASNRSGQFDLYFSKRPDRSQPFEGAQALSELNSDFLEVNLSLTADGLEAFFLSERPGGLGERDIWTATRTSVDEPFANVRNLQEVNTAYVESGSSISANGLALFWSDAQTGAQRPGGMGGADIWCATRESRDEPFGDTVNLGSPINSAAADYWIRVSARWPEDGSSIYFSRCRNCDFESDIYQATWRLLSALLAPAFTLTSEEGDEPLQVTADATSSTSPNGAIITYSWDFGDGETATGATVTHAYPNPGHYELKLTVEDQKETASLSKFVTVNFRSEAVSPWTAVEVGDPPLVKGGARPGATGCLDLYSGGTGLGRNADQFFFVFQTLSGDGSVTARVNAADLPPNGRVGVMLRADLTAGSANAVMTVIDTGTLKYSFGRRETAGGLDKPRVNASDPVNPPDAWVRIQRQGSELIGSYSSDGKTWTELRRATFTLPVPVLGGIAITAVDSAGQYLTARATVCDLSVVGANEVTRNFRRGDANGDRTVDLSDGVSVLNHLYLGAGAPACMDAADANDDGTVDLSDAVFDFSFLFLGAEAPPKPGPSSCGPDPTEDGLPSCVYETTKC